MKNDHFNADITEICAYYKVVVIIDVVDVQGDCSALRARFNAIKQILMFNRTQESVGYCMASPSLG